MEPQKKNLEKEKHLAYKLPIFGFHVSFRGVYILYSKPFGDSEHINLGTSIIAKH